ncbi:hypothetical protein TNIN_424561 [Trichonephila inaurata madagascariensis]|uniref:Uncharacterized protein n=1 Tax=Trichonephila inaurata madagascariensis TaxID=2747483 RepID=A0A8X6XLY2_9ARAC|nr:hypothetical protein TNIN_424561 [Trichonephila inaurata madagascariensis]
MDERISEHVSQGNAVPTAYSSFSSSHTSLRRISSNRRISMINIALNNNVMSTEIVGVVIGEGCTSPAEEEW